MQFVQFKLPAKVEHGPLNLPKGWVLSKHKPHLTFFEIKIDSSILAKAIEWLLEKSEAIEAMVSCLEFSTWTIFYKRKLNIAVLSPLLFQDIDVNPNFTSNPIIEARAKLMHQLFKEFGATEIEKGDVEGLPLWLYKDQAGKALFSCSLYNRPEVWYPHVSMAVKFTHLEERHDTTDWTVAKARVGKGLYHEIINKP
jgi:hypothetical protein